MAEQVRTFIAIDLPDEIRHKADDLIADLQSAPAKVKWVESENLHITLKFLGDVDLREVHRVCNAVTAAVAELEPFTVELTGVGAFPDVKRPRTVWVGVTEGIEDIRKLHQSVETKLAELKFRKERRQYHPHLTVGRVRRGSGGLKELAERLVQCGEMPFGTLPVQELLVISSRLEPDGPVYEVLSRAPLGG